MPFIATRTNKTIDQKTSAELKSALGRAICAIPGKSEAWLMLAFEDNINMYFKGDGSEDYAYIEVSLFGTTSDAAYERLTAAISEIINEELGIERANIYIKYETTDHWGWNGVNF